MREGLPIHGQGGYGPGQPQPKQRLVPPRHPSKPRAAPLCTLPLSTLQAGLPGYCRGLCWRPFTPGMPPMLCVGVGQQVCVWQYVLALNTWQVGGGWCGAWPRKRGRSVRAQG